MDWSERLLLVFSIVIFIVASHRLYLYKWDSQGRAAGAKEKESFADSTIFDTVAGLKAEIAALKAPLERIAEASHGQFVIAKENQEQQRKNEMLADSSMDSTSGTTSGTGAASSSSTSSLGTGTGTGTGTVKEGFKNANGKLSSKQRHPIIQPPWWVDD